MGQIARVNLHGQGCVRSFVHEATVRESFGRVISLKRYLERVQHTDPQVAVAEILPFRQPDRQGDDAAA